MGIISPKNPAQVAGLQAGWHRQGFKTAIAPEPTAAGRLPIAAQRRLGMTAMASLH
jgi:hypothetical protein